MAAPSRTATAASLLVVAAGVSVSLGVYAKTHSPSGRAIFTLGFSGMLPMKAWLTTLAVLLVIAQLLTALWMWRRLPAAGDPPPWVSGVHRWTGSVAFLVTLPVAFHCMWSLGFGSYTTRVLLHSVAGCAFYGAYAAKMLGLRITGLPGWALPVIGGTVLSLVVVLWLTSSLWFFTQSGVPLT
jgi:hypothetical protein